MNLSLHSLSIGLKYVSVISLFGYGYGVILMNEWFKQSLVLTLLLRIKSKYQIVGAEAGIGGISEDEGAAERGSQKMGEPLTSSPWPCKAL